MLTGVEDASSLQTDKDVDKRVGQIANLIIEKIKESSKILFPDVRDHVDK